MSATDDSSKTSIEECIDELLNFDEAHVVRDAWGSPLEHLPDGARAQRHRELVHRFSVRAGGGLPPDEREWNPGHPLREVVTPELLQRIAEAEATVRRASQHHHLHVHVRHP